MARTFLSEIKEDLYSCAIIYGQGNIEIVDWHFL